MSILSRLILFLFLLVTVFDPADLITHLKVPLFVLIWFVFGLDLLFSSEPAGEISSALLKYILCFSILLPALSISLYILRNGLTAPYDGFQYFKSYLFLALAIIITLKKIDLTPMLSFILTGLAGAAIVLFLFTYDNPAFSAYIWAVGDSYGFVTPASRSYADLSYSYVYFYTSPLLVLSLAYFSYRTMTVQTRARYIYFALLLVNILGMLVSGPRNNLVFGIVTPLLVLTWYSTKRQRLILIALFFLIAVVAASHGTDIVGAMLDPENESNAIKLAHLHDYEILFRNPMTLLFGQGLGSYFFATGFGYRTSITELTYLEFIRNFGLPIALIYYALLLYPLTRLLDRTFAASHYLILAYGCYLLICLSNPLLLSSSGMLVLAIVLCRALPTTESLRIPVGNPVTQEGAVF